jgi:NAD(P)-dependent dehydrogenase (short-subunit alcohol dehydrogenase family)
MKVVVTGIAEDRIARGAADINREGGKAIAAQADRRESRALDRLADSTEKAFGRVRLFISNAGIETLGYSWERSAGV